MKSRNKGTNQSAHIKQKRIAVIEIRPEEIYIYIYLLIWEGSENVSNKI